MSKYNTEKFKHVTVALNTPFAKDGNIDVEAVKAVSRYFRDKGVKQMYVCGSTGNRNSADLSHMFLCFHACCSKRDHYSGRMSDGRFKTSIPACSDR